MVISNKAIKDPIQPQNDPALAGKDVRIVNFMEVYDMDYSQVQLLLKEVSATYHKNRDGINYVIPIRHGKISTDILFESEILDFINQICEVRNGEIALKQDAQEVHVIRRKI